MSMSGDPSSYDVAEDDSSHDSTPDNDSNSSPDNTATDDNAFHEGSNEAAAAVEPAAETSNEAAAAVEPVESSNIPTAEPVTPFEQVPGDHPNNPVESSNIPTSEPTVHHEGFNEADAAIAVEPVEPPSTPEVEPVRVDGWVDQTQRLKDLTLMLGSEAKAREFIRNYLWINSADSEADGTYPTRGTSTEEEVEREQVENPKMGVGYDYGSSEVIPERAEEMWQNLPQEIRDMLQNPPVGYSFRMYGSASAPGGEAYNFQLSKERAENLVEYLKEHFGVKADIEIYPLGETLTETNSETMDDSSLRTAWLELAKVPSSEKILEKLELLGQRARNDGKVFDITNNGMQYEGRQFSAAVNAFVSDLDRLIDAARQQNLLSPGLSVVMTALEMWRVDPGNQWGEGRLDSNDLVPTAPEYVTIPADQDKCNIFVAEAIYRATGVVHKAFESKETPGKYFPYRAGQWSNLSVSIPNFQIVDKNKAQMGDIWARGTHVGIYLGEYNGIKLYISARDEPDGVFGVGVGNAHGPDAINIPVQHAHGIQIKHLPEGGTFRRYIQ